MIGKTNACGGGKSSGVYGFIHVTYPEGATCTCTKGSVSLTAADTSGSAVFKVPSSGTWTVNATYGTQSAESQVTISTEGGSESTELTFRVPTGYREVNYIASTANGGQYIDLGYTFGTVYDYSWTLKIKFMLLGTSDTAVIGSFNGVQQGWVTLPLASSDGTVSFIAAGAVFASSIKANTIYEVEISRSGVRINGGSLQAWSTTPQYTDPLGLTLHLYGANTQAGHAYNASAIRIYSFEIPNTMEFVPCLNPSNVPGFYDTVRERFISSASGTFSYG